LNWYEVREAIAPVTNVSNSSETGGTGNSSQASSASDAPATTAQPQSNAPKEKIAGTREVERPRVPGDDD